MEPEEDFLHHPVPGESQGGRLHSVHCHVLCGWVHQKGDGTTKICIKNIKML